MYNTFLNPHIETHMDRLLKSSVFPFDFSKTPIAKCNRIGAINGTGLIYHMHIVGRREHTGRETV